MSVASPPVWSDPTNTAVDVATGGIWTATAIDSLCSNLAVLGGADGSSGTAGKPNLLTNGGFEVWQRGTSFSVSTTTATYTADRWYANLGASSSASISQDSVNATGPSQYSMSVSYTHSAASSIAQQLEMWPQLRGQTVSLSMAVKVSTANAVRIGLYDGTANYYSAYHPGDGAYHVLTVTATLSATANACSAFFTLEASCTAKLDNAMLIRSGAALGYQPLPPAEEWMRCQRYYEIVGTQGSSIIVNGIATAAAQTATTVLSYKQTKPVTPTISRVGTWSLVNASAQPTATGDLTCCYLAIASSAAGQFSAYNNVSGAFLIIESNP